MKTTTNPVHVDLSMLEKDTLGNRAVLSKLIQLFLKSIDEFTSALTNLWPGDQWEELHGATHKIKPIIPMFGIAALGDEMTELEALFKNKGDNERINTLVAKCHKVLAEVKLELEDELTPEPHEEF